MADSKNETSRFNIPNLLTCARLVASPVVLLLAYYQFNVACLAVFLVAALTDWLDGVLARTLHQRTNFGARLDSVADVALYGALIVSLIWMRPSVMEAEWTWIVAAMISYSLHVALGLIRFRALPSYHLITAKACWAFVLAALAIVLADGPGWVIRIASGAVVLTNIEGMAVTFLVGHPQTNIPTIFHAARIRHNRDQAGH